MARGEGIEPSITGPEPAVLPITPPPNAPTIGDRRAGVSHCSAGMGSRHAGKPLASPPMLDFMWGYVMGQKSAAQASAFARSAGAADALTGTRKLNDVDERIDRLLLLVEAMWALLKEQGFSDEELADKLAELDAVDGTGDGRHTPKPSDCGACGSKVAAGLRACQFCGTALPQTSAPTPFDSL